MASGSNKEIKTLLKNARDSIKTKEYKEALKHCKAVLKLDNTNYNAFVFIGKAATELDQLDQARMAYKRATENDPNQLLAWQGLCDLCERSDTDQNQCTLVDVYEKMMGLLHGSDKWLSVAQKLIKLQETKHDTKQVIKIIVSILESGVLENDSAKLPWWLKLVSLLSNNKDCTSEDRVLLEDGYRNLLEMLEDEAKVEEMFTRLIALLRQKPESNDQIVELSKKMLTRLPSSMQPLQALAQVHLTVTQGTCPEAIEVFHQLQEMDGRSGLANLGLGKVKLEENKYIEAKAHLEKGVKSVPSSVYGWLYLSRAMLMVHDNHGVEKATQKGIKLLKTSGTCPDLTEQFLFVKAKALLDRGTASAATDAVEVFKELLITTTSKIECLCCLSESYCVLGQLDQAQQYCSDATLLDPDNSFTVALTWWIAGLQEHYAEAEQRLSDAAVILHDNAKIYFWLGKVQWESGEESRKNKSKCLNNFMKAAKLDPYSSSVFQYLGYYYQQVAHDIRRAKSCFKKSFDLNLENEDSGTAYADICLATGDEDATLSMLQAVTSQAPAGTMKWAWLRLGLYQLKQNKPNIAVTSFQSALRADTKDSHCWECMGDAYKTRGSYSAALKAFTRGHELDASSIYCQYQIASIKQILGQYPEALSDYRMILNTQPEYIPALKGLGETYLLLGRESIVHFFNGRAVDYVTRSIAILQRAAALRPDLSCLWKLLGDVCTILHPLDPELVRVDVASILLDASVESNDTVHVGKDRLLSIGARCYGRALQLLPDCSSLWHDLGINYLRQIQYIQEESLANKAVQCLKKAVALDSSSPAHWNALGVVCSAKEVNKPDLAQHAFIKSIQIEESNVVAWTNLGTLYLKHGDIEKAHEAFKKSQSINPDYVQCWIGQAHIAESINDEETMDLYRHTCELASHIEGTIGYAHWVCSTILNHHVDVNSETYNYSIKQMNAVSTSTLAISKYTDRIRNDACSYNMLGLLLERQGLHQEAQKAFKRVIDILDNMDVIELMNKARANYARSLCMTKHYGAAVLEYQKISPLVLFEDVCGLALALYKAGKYQESYQAYEQALQLTESDVDKSHVLSAMGMVTDDPDQAKTVLFKCSQLSSPSVYGLLALCSLGITYKDVQLASAALSELKKHANSSEVAEDICFMGACVCALQGQGKLAYQQICKAVHSYPSNVKLWNRLSYFLLQLAPEKSMASVRCSKIAENLGFDLEYILVHMALAQLITGQHEEKKTGRSCLISAQKSVHLYPGNLAAWTTLSSCQLAQTILQNNSHTTKHLTSGLAQFVFKLAESECDIPLQRWGALHLASTLIQDGCHQEAQTFCQNAKKSFISDPIISSMLESLELQSLLKTKSMSTITMSDIKILKSYAVADATSTHAWQVLGQLHETKGMMDCAEDCYRQALQQATLDKAVPLVRLALLALHNICNQEGSDSEHWEQLLQEAVGEVLKIDPGCAIIWLIHGCFLHRTDDTRQSKWCFQQARELASDKSSVEAKVARYYLTKLLIAKGKLDAASTMIEEAIVHGDNAIEELQELLTIEKDFLY